VAGYREAGKKDLLWIYEPGSQEATSLANTEGAMFPFWSPDGRALAFFADGRLKKLEFSSGAVQTLCNAPTGRGGTWNKDGVILFTPSGQLGAGLYRIQASGGTPTPVTSPDRSKAEDSDRWPVFLPDGTHYLYLAVNLSGEKALHTVYLGSLNSSEKREIIQARANVGYAAPGYLFYYRDQTLFVQRFDNKKFELTGEPAPILTDVQYFPRVAKAVFAATDAGLLVSQKSSGTGASQVLWFDRKGKELGVAVRPGVYGNISLARSGKVMAADTTDQASQNTDIWTYSLEDDNAQRLTFDPSIDSMPTWSSDGTRLVFASNRNLKFDLYVKSANGAEEEKPAVQDGPDKFPNSWSRDGKYILYERGADLWFVTLPDLRSSQFLKAPSTLKGSQFSPDGKWVAYSSNENGRWEVYVTSFPDTHGKWQVSNAGGEQPRWRGDGKELFYLSPDGQMMAVPVTTGGDFDPGTPVALFQANPRELLATSEQFTYDVSEDGQKFLINTQMKQTETVPMSVMLNWSAKLNK
jgi:eukaryotic-like serine/threonine-protein kinase